MQANVNKKDICEHSPIDISTKSSQLLGRLANSLYDRDCASIKKPFFFTLGEVKIVEDFLKEALRSS